MWITNNLHRSFNHTVNIYILYVIIQCIYYMFMIHYTLFISSGRGSRKSWGGSSLSQSYIIIITSVRNTPSMQSMLLLGSLRACPPGKF